MPLCDSITGMPSHRIELHRSFCKVATGENRFELWFSKGRFNRLILIAALLSIWLLCDFLLAVVVVRTGYAKPEEFFMTPLRASTRPGPRGAPHANVAVSTASFRISGSFQADGLLGARLVPNFLVIMPSARRNREESMDGTGNIFWFMTDEYGFPPVARVGHHYQVCENPPMYFV